MRFDLTKIIDRLEPSIDFSQLIASKNYGVTANETIKEEEDENIGEKGILSLEMFSKLKAQHEKVNSMRYLDIVKVKTRKIKSICLESEPILEELEE